MMSAPAVLGFSASLQTGRWAANLRRRARVRHVSLGCDQRCNALGVLPLPNISAFTRVFDALWGEGWGEGVTHRRSSCNTLNPALSPSGERVSYPARGHTDHP